MTQGLVNSLAPWRQGSECWVSRASHPGRRGPAHTCSRWKRQLSVALGSEPPSWPGGWVETALQRWCWNGGKGQELEWKEQTSHREVSKRWTDLHLYPIWELALAGMNPDTYMSAAEEGWAELEAWGLGYPAVSALSQSTGLPCPDSVLKRPDQVLMTPLSPSGLSSQEPAASSLKPSFWNRALPAWLLSQNLFYWLSWRPSQGPPASNTWAPSPAPAPSSPTHLPTKPQSSDGACVLCPQCPRPQWPSIYQRASPQPGPEPSPAFYTHIYNISTWSCSQGTWTQGIPNSGAGWMCRDLPPVVVRWLFPTGSTRTLYCTSSKMPDRFNTSLF